MVRRRLVLSLVCAAALFGAVTEKALAFEFDITALFKPDSANPLINEFENTTQQSGYCFYYPGECSSPKIISFRLDTDFPARFPIEANHPLESQGAMLGVPGQWRSLTVTNLQNGDKEEVEVRIAGIGATHALGRAPVQELVGVSDDIGAVPAWDMLWVGGTWGNGAGPCKSGRYSGITSHIYSFFFYVPPVDGVCAKQAKFNIPEFKYRTFDIGYELRTPKPLSMASGVYVGTISYPLGRGGIDLGDNIHAANGDTVMNLNFTLDVQHTLKVEIPPGGNKVELVPQGGWQAWLNQGRKPTRLFRDQTFNLSASSRFKMSLECQYPTGNTCALQEPTTGDPVPVIVSVSLPNGLTDAAGQPITRRPLRLDGSGTELFRPGFYVDREPGTLHFEIAQDEVKEMLKPGVARTYSGNVTVIWDSEVG